MAFYCTSNIDVFSLKPWMQKVGLVLDLILCKWSWSPDDYCYEGSNYPTTLFCLPVQSNRMCTGEANCWEKLLLVCMTDQERSKFISDSLRQIFLLPLPLGEEDYNALSSSKSFFFFFKFCLSFSYFRSLIHLFKEVRYNFRQTVCKICSVVSQTIVETESRFQ